MRYAITAVAVSAVVSMPAWGSQFDDAMNKCDAGPTAEYKQCVATAYAQRDHRPVSVPVVVPQEQAGMTIQKQVEKQARQRKECHDVGIDDKERCAAHVAELRAKSDALTCQIYRITDKASCDIRLKKERLKNAEMEAKREAAERQEDEQRTKPYPRIGMSTSEVITGTSWGKSLEVNTTVTSGGTTEQWVYIGGRYLYFTNGVLTAIQK